MLDDLTESENINKPVIDNSCKHLKIIFTKCLDENEGNIEHCINLREKFETCIKKNTEISNNIN